MAKQTIRLNEAQLNRAIRESLEEVIGNNHFDPKASMKCTPQNKLRAELFHIGQYINDMKYEAEKMQDKSLLRCLFELDSVLEKYGYEAR